MKGTVLLIGFLFELFFLFRIDVHCENSVSGRLEFNYNFFRNDHSRAMLCLKKDHDCYFYNMTGQDRIDVHDPIKIFAIESKVLALVHTPNTFVKGSMDLYNHELIYFKSFCSNGNLTLWLMK